MQVLPLGENIAADAVAAQAGIQLVATPFYPGRQVVAIVDYSGNMAAAATVLVQSAPDNATWTTVMTSSTLVPKYQNVATDLWMRMNVTVAGTAGSKCSAYLLADN